MQASHRAILAFSALVIGAVPSLTWAADSLVGTWRLVSLVSEETESKAVHEPYGDKPSGLITYTSDGYLVYIITDPTRRPPVAPKATDAEAAQLYRTMGAYAGRYKIENDELIVNPEVASSPALVGTEQTYVFEVKGDRYELKTNPFVSPAIGKQVVTTLVWERVK
jgi:Lipocalin-like domain